MSEYQYYEFQAVDRPLTAEAVTELRAYSTRARITPTIFVNDYSWGNFKGDEDGWMERYFDVFLYLANWGTRVLKLALPNRLLDLETAQRYCVADSASVQERNGKVILTVVSEDDEGGEWIDGEGWLSSFVSLRADVARGDLRTLYLAWLLRVQNGDVDDHAIEPPIPRGASQLGAALQELVEFLRIDRHLVAAAARSSGPPVKLEPTFKEIRQWVAKQPAVTKDDLLAQVMIGETAVAGELVQRMSREDGGDADQRGPGGRTVGNLLRQAEVITAEQRRVKAETAAREKARHEKEWSLARTRCAQALPARAVGQSQTVKGFWLRNHGGRRLECVLCAMAAAAKMGRTAEVREHMKRTVGGEGPGGFITKILNTELGP